ncbi:MAG: hypothetical protein WA715_23600 [Candidatus Acidiferrum sp.]
MRRPKIRNGRPHPKGATFSVVEEARWGSITKLRLPSGAEIGLYQPKHKTALQR